MINPHEGHHMKPLDYVLQQAEETKQKLQVQIEEKTKKIEAAINYFAGLKEIFSEQRDLFLKKLNADFDVIQKMLDRKRSELQDKIRAAYDGHVIKTMNFTEGLSSLSNVLAQISRSTIHIDLDQVLLNKTLSSRLNDIESQIDFQV